MSRPKRVTVKYSWMNRDEVKRCDNSEIHLFLTLLRIFKWLKLRINVEFEALKQKCPFHLAASFWLLDVLQSICSLLALDRCKPAVTVSRAEYWNCDCWKCLGLTNSREKLELSYIIDLNVLPDLIRRERWKLKWKDVLKAYSAWTAWFAMPSAFFLQDLHKR